MSKTKAKYHQAEVNGKNSWETAVKEKQCALMKRVEIVNYF